MKIITRPIWKNFKLPISFILSFLILGSFVANADASMEIRKGILYVSYTRGYTNCTSGRRTNDVRILVNGVQRIRFAGGGAIEINYSVRLESNEMGRPVGVQIKEAEGSCSGHDTNSYKLKASLADYAPFYTSVGIGSYISGGFSGPCNPTIRSWNGRPTDEQVQQEIYDKPENNFVAEKGSHSAYGISFDFYLGGYNYRRVEYYTGAIGKPEDRIQIYNNPSSVVRATYRPTELYLNAQNSYTRLLIFECYNQNNALAKLIAIPITVIGAQTKYAKGTNGRDLITKSAPILNRVLHKVPGDNSYSYIETNVTSCSEISMDFSQGNNQASDVTLTVGADFTLFGVGVESEFSTTGSYSSSMTEGNGSSTEICRTITQKFSNTSNRAGEDGDLFLGNYTTFKYGAAVIVEYNDCKVRVAKKSLHFSATETVDFNYTKYDIESKVLPKLRRDRDSEIEGSTNWKMWNRDIKAWEDMISKNSDNIRSATTYEGRKTFYGQLPISPEEKSVRIARTQNYRINSSLIIDKSLLTEAGVEVGGSGVSGSFEVGITTEVSQSSNNTTEHSQETGYSLADDDPDDEFHIRIKKDRMFGTPIFELLEETKTSCPFEGGDQLNQPVLNVLEDGIERKSLTIFSSSVDPSGIPFVEIPLKITNASANSREYRLQTDNAADAMVTLGVNLLGLEAQSKKYTLDPEESVTLNGIGRDILRIKPNPISPKSYYEGIQIGLYSICEEEKIYDTVTLNIFFMSDFCPNPALDFDGINDYVEIAYAPKNNRANFTAEAWVYPTRSSGTFESIISSRDINSQSGACGYILYRDPTNKWLFMMGGGAGAHRVQSTSSVEMNTWTHLAISFDGTSMRLLVNGKLEGEKELANLVRNTRQPLRIGAGATETDPRFFFKGAIDDVRIWSIARTETDIRSHRYNELQGDESGLVAYYTFDQGTINADNSYLRRLSDEAVRSRQFAQLEGFTLSGATSNWTTGIEMILNDKDGNGISDACEAIEDCYGPDPDRDGLADLCDNCPDLANRALSFDGIDDYVYISNPTGIPIANSAYTIEAWIFANSMGNKGIIGWGNYGVPNQMNALRLTENGLRNYWWTQNIEATTGDLTGSWHHVAATYDGSICKLYLDGAVIASDHIDMREVPNARNFIIGKTWGSQYFDGRIDEVRVWNIARSEEEIVDNLTQELAGNEEGLVAYYTFNQGAVWGDNTSLRTLNDLSTNNNTGSLKRFALTPPISSGRPISNWARGAALQHHDSDGDGIGDPCDSDSPSYAMAAQREAEISNKEHTGFSARIGFGDVETSLEQNYPNPAKELTKIPLSLPQGARDVLIQITNMTGQVLNRIPVSERGATELQFSTQELPSGIYFYSLIIDGELFGTKRMSVVK